MRLNGVDIARIPLDEAIPIVWVYLLRNLSKDDQEEMQRDLDKPLSLPQIETRTKDEMEDDELFAVLGLRGLRTKKATPAPLPPPSVD